MSSSSSKRSRLSRSSSQGETLTLIPMDSPLGFSNKPTLDASVTPLLGMGSSLQLSNLEHKKSIWTLGGDDDLSIDDGDQFHNGERFGTFWQTCALCKKHIHDQMNIYMYGFLQAFCSVECRGAKIAVDDLFGRPPQRPTGSTSRKPGRRPEVARFK